MCIDDNECDTECAEEGGGGDIDSAIASTWIRLGGRGGGPIELWIGPPVDLDATWLATDRQHHHHNAQRQ